MVKFKKKLIIKQVFANTEEDVMFEIKFSKDDMEDIHVKVNEFKTRNAAVHLMVNISAFELVSFIKSTDFSKVIKRRTNQNIISEEKVFEMIMEEWCHICRCNMNISLWDMFRLEFVKDEEVEKENEENEEKEVKEISKEDQIIEGIKGINEKLEKIFEFLVLQKMK